MGLNSIIKNLLFTYHLEINSDTLVFSNILRSKKIVTKEIPLTQICAVSFDFIDTIEGSAISIMDEAQYEMTQKIIAGDEKLSDLGKSIKSTFSTLQLNIERLDVIDKINLEAILQTIINEKGGNVVV